MRDAAGRPRGAHLTVGESVEGLVDEERRFDHIQQHSGQHILSRAFLDVASAPTRSFHLGESICTIDVDLPAPTEETIRAAEVLANRIVREDRAVQVSEAPAGEPGSDASPGSADSEPGAKPDDPIRIIEIERFDRNPCGGTHVERTGQVGIICVLAWEPYKKLCRVTFACGVRVARLMREALESLNHCVARLSAPQREVPAALDKLLGERDALRKRLRERESRIAGYEAESLAASASAVGPYRLLRALFRAEERSVDEAQMLVRRYVEPPGRLAVVGVIEGEKGTLLAARSAGEGPLLGDLVGEACRAAGGRGGGSPVLARAGGIPRERLEETIDRVIERLRAGASPGPP
jgi:alanyl-tRNA synthetase